jgi:hypothetical protein
MTPNDQLVHGQLPMQDYLRWRNSWRGRYGRINHVQRYVLGLSTQLLHGHVRAPALPALAQ